VQWYEVCAKFMGSVEKQVIRILFIFLYLYDRASFRAVIILYTVLSGRIGRDKERRKVLIFSTFRCLIENISTFSTNYT
jgi:hypothetical protein